jgi:selenocysteine-specific elongation factor
MKHVIIGTAGHIDHGKTTLIKALTGRETDTLKEEKERGISINLGFTFFDLPSGKRAGIIDVPGHEKFIKNALAGVSSIDVVLLVIAADEGIMPQTKEHYEILQLLNVKKGIIVLTKTDLVEEEWLSLIKEEIKEYFNGTFLENAPIHEVSSKTGKGIKELIEDIDIITDEVETKDTEGHFRLTVDRVFSVSGFGTVVTGTIISGRINEGEAVQLYPSKVLTKVRGIQVHENSVKFAEAGQRSAINLANVKVEEVHRGDILSKEAVMESSLIVDCSLNYLKSAKGPLVNRQRVRLYHGTSELLCRVILIDREELLPGDKTYVQLRLEQPLTAQRKDSFVIRNYSPMYTIGGGQIIEPAAKKAKRFDVSYIEDLKVKECGSQEDILVKLIEKLSKDYPDEQALIKTLGKNDEKLGERLGSLEKDKVIIKLINLDKPIYIHKSFLKLKTSEIEKLLIGFHNEYPLKVGISKEEIKNKVFGKGIKQKTYDEILQLLSERNVISMHGSFISLIDFEIKYTKEQEKIKNKILKSFEEAKYIPPKYDEFVQEEKDKKAFKMVYDSLFEMGSLTKVSEDCVLLTNLYEDAKTLIIKFIKEQESISAAQARDILNTSRKYAVAILENLDNIKITRRLEDVRVLFKE